MTKAYDEFIAAAARGLADDEFWVISHPEGPLWDTASKRLDVPVLILCEALEVDWDVACESGYFLAKLRRPVEATGAA